MTDEIPLREGKPDAEDCTARRRIRVTVRGQIVEGWACWYPQMGGYVGMCLVIPRPTYPAEGHCFDVLIWHDGDFPFGDGQPPIELHHCMADQFIGFGENLRAIATESDALPPASP